MDVFHSYSVTPGISSDQRWRCNLGNVVEPHQSSMVLERPFSIPVYAGTRETISRHWRWLITMLVTVVAVMQFGIANASDDNYKREQSSSSRNSKYSESSHHNGDSGSGRDHESGSGEGGDTSGGGSAGGGTGGGSSGGGTTTGASYAVFASNDLGMHCMDKEFSVFSILPPFNVVNAQVVRKSANGTPVVLGAADVDVTYSAVVDAAGSINSSSINKTDFWNYATPLFGVNLPLGQGLGGCYMPQDNPNAPGPQPMAFDPNLGMFSANGIPITPTDDLGMTNTYSLMRITATDKVTGVELAHLDTVVPVAQETDCAGCHATGKIAASEGGVNWAADTDIEVQAKKNVLILHDREHGTDLSNKTPVLCASCHYSKALDLAGAGHNAEQAKHHDFSWVMHNFHGKLADASGAPLFPPAGPANDTCYQCHPGKITQCQRGAMRNGGMECASCHGTMLAVGGEYPLASGGSIDGTNDGGTRRPWTDLPRCQSCHTGDAVDHLTGTNVVTADDGIRLKQAYRNGDNAASPILATNKRFAENTDTLYRFSKGHGGIACEGCHGSTHAIWPNATASANDNVAATQLQGHGGTVIECGACHAAGSLALTTDGPHGMHNVDDSRWVNENHGSYYRKDAAGCQACHGTNLGGTALARVAANRSYNVEGRSVQLSKGDAVACNLCHKMP